MLATAFTSAPVIETERLILRPHSAADHDAYATMWADANVTRYTSGRPLSREESWIRILRQVGHWHVVGYGFWVLEDRATGKLAGETGFHDLRRDIEPALGGTPEAGWLLASAFHGKGYAREAVHAVHAWSDANLACAKTVCIIHPEHAGSLRVADIFGYRNPVPARYRDEPSLILSREKPAVRE